MRKGCSTLWTTSGIAVAVDWEFDDWAPRRDCYEITEIDSRDPRTFPAEFVRDCYAELRDLNPAYLPDAFVDVTPRDTDIWVALGCGCGSVGEMVIDGCLHDEWRHAERAKAWRELPVAERHQAMAFAGIDQ